MHGQNCKAPFDEEGHAHRTAISRPLSKRTMSLNRPSRKLRPDATSTTPLLKQRGRPCSPFQTILNTKKPGKPTSAARNPPTYSPRARALAEAVRQADEEYKDAVSAIASKHNVTIH